MTSPQGQTTQTSLLSDKLYQKLKATALIVLPASGALYFGLAQIWGLPAAEQVIGTITVVDTFLGVLLGISTSSYNKSDAKYDGTFVVENTEDGSNLRLQSVDLDALSTKDELVFKVYN
jgi:hypothetical protein